MNEKTRSIITHIVSFILFCFCFSAVKGYFFKKSGVSSRSLDKLDNLIDDRAESDYNRIQDIIDSIRS